MAGLVICCIGRTHHNHFTWSLASQATLRSDWLKWSSTPKGCSQANPKKVHIDFAVDNEKTDLANVLGVSFAEYLVKLIIATDTIYSYGQDP